ncbi:MAG TPA: hypothetical protein VE153_00300 [Myxococcus sp.]|nr:hypothetical protein [Myxococcus sp.]
MPQLPVTRHAWHAALLLASGLAASCGDPKPPETPDPPQVTLTVPEGNVVGTSIKVLVAVTGCEKVKTLNLYDRETLLKPFTYTESPTPLELVARDIPFPAVGMAANLSLVAEAECQDGRKNKSQPQPAIFFPVSRVVTDPQGQVVTDFFVVEGSDSNASFIGCGNPGTGTPTMYRVGANGRVMAEKAMPVPCTPDTVITASTNTGKRWVWTPGGAAYTIDSNLEPTSQTGSELQIASLTVLPDGDAVAISLNGNTMERWRSTSTATGTLRWRYDPPGRLLGAPMVRGDRVLAAVQDFGNGNDQAQIVVHEVVADTGPTVGGEAQTRTHIRNLLGINGAAPLIPVTSFSDDGNTLYLGVQLAGDQSQVLACPATANCDGNALWTSTVLPARTGLVLPYASGTRLAVIGAQRVWFLDTSTGAIRNKDGATVNANGALNVLKVGVGAFGSNSLFLLNGPARTGAAPTLPQEIVAVDQAGNGDVRELFRYQVPTNMSAAVDDSGRLWMRAGFNLVQALPLSEYRRFRP